jgi:hypothetical protein
MPCASWSARNRAAQLVLAIFVTACHVDPGVPGHRAFTPGAQNYWVPDVPATLTVGYANDAPIATREASFALVERSFSLTTVRDVRSVAPGATVARTFTIERSLFGYLVDPPTCAALSADYRDGTSWRTATTPRPFTTFPPTPS